MPLNHKNRLKNKILINKMDKIPPKQDKTVNTNSKFIERWNRGTKSNMCRTVNGRT